MAMWSPWRGCHRFSEGCKFCYIHKGDARRGVDTGKITLQEKSLYAPIERKKDGSYKMKAGQTVYTCFSTDFFLADADEWRSECWKMMRERQDLNFLFLTKRIERFYDCVPADWGEGYENVTIGCTVENQKTADERLTFFSTLPIRHKVITAQPLIEKIEIGAYLKGIDLVVVGGESDRNARELDYDWVLAIREECKEAGVHFSFRQCGTNFRKDGKLYHLKTRDLGQQARKADIDF